MNCIELKDGSEYPLIGLGTYGLDPNRIKYTIKEAVDLGYRKFDCAWIYNNEEIIGDAIKNSGIIREDIWLTTKLHIKDITFGSYRHGVYFPKKTIRKAFEQACKRLRTDYIDTYMLHWPWKGYLHMWEELLKLYESGLVKTIGITGALPYHFQEIERRFDITPMVNQVEFHPYNCDMQLLNYCKSKQCVLESFSSFGSGPRNAHLAGAISKEEVLVNLSIKYNRSVQQIILRWLTQMGIPIIPRSNSALHQKDNLNIFDFVLQEDELAAISGLNKGIYSWADPHETLPKK